MSQYQHEFAPECKITYIMMHAADYTKKKRVKNHFPRVSRRHVGREQHRCLFSSRATIVRAKTSYSEARFPATKDNQTSSKRFRRSLAGGRIFSFARVRKRDDPLLGEVGAIPDGRFVEWKDCDKGMKEWRRGGEGGECNNGGALMLMEIMYRPGSVNFTYYQVDTA